MARLYVAGPLFNAQDRERLDRIEAALSAAGHATFLPHRDAGDNLITRVADGDARPRSSEPSGSAAKRRERGEHGAATRGPDDEASADERRRRIFAADMAGLAGSDAVVALLDGADVDAGTAFEIGWAYANRRPVLGVRTDFRTLGPEGPVSVMVLVACDRFIHAHDMEWEALAAEITAWADGVSPWGGRMVRDGVPHLAKERGHALRFRKAEGQERTAAIKAKLAETARVLEAAPVAEETDPLADLLEATEAYIRARGWDKATLKALKERRWKERGGYEEGWVVEDAEAVTAEAKAAQG